LQRKLADRARELEDDNRDRQKERDEHEHAKLKHALSNSRLNPSAAIVGTVSAGTSLLEKYKRGGTVIDNSTVSTPSPNPIPTPLFSGLKMELKASININNRLQAIASNQAGQAISQRHKDKVTEFSDKDKPTTPALISPAHVPSVSTVLATPLGTSATLHIKSTSNPSTPNSLTSPAQAKASPGILSGKFQMTVGGVNNNNAQSSKPGEEDDSRMSFSSPGMPSPAGMASASPQTFNNDGSEKLISVGRYCVYLIFALC